MASCLCLLQDQNLSIYDVLQIFSMLFTVEIIFFLPLTYLQFLGVIFKYLEDTVEKFTFQVSQSVYKVNLTYSTSMQFIGFIVMMADVDLGQQIPYFANVTTLAMQEKPIFACDFFKRFFHNAYSGSFSFLQPIKLHKSGHGF